MTTELPHDRTGAPPIVVGIDGSTAALHALAWAVQEAKARHCAVEVIHAWDNIPLPGNMFTGPEELRRASECLVQNESAAAIHGLTDPPTITELSVKGPAARVLIDHSHGAAMLVVGRSRHTAFKDLLPKSVSASCVRSAACPVVVVPAPTPVVEHTATLVGAGPGHTPE